MRENLLKSLNHESGKVPFDLGATAVTGLHVTCIDKLRDYYGLEKKIITAYEPYQMLGEVDDDLREAMGIDTIGVCSPYTMFGFINKDFKEWRAPWGQDLLVSSEFNITYKDNDIYIYPEGDLTAPASGHMPAGGYFFDTIVRQGPIDDDNLNPADNLEEYGLISDELLEYFKINIEKAANSGYGVVANFGGTAFGDIALIPAPALKHPKGIRDITEWYISTAIRQDYVHEIFSKQLEYALANLAKIYSVVGNKVDAVFLCGTDFGTQSGSFCSTEVYNELWAPYYKKMNDWIHKNTTWKTFKHSCGAVENFMDNFIDSGWDIINPVQCSAQGMDPKILKDRYGEKLTFWGGAIDTQHILPFGTPKEVRAQALERCEIFSKGGGFVYNAIHNIQANTPVENIVALVEAIKEFNGDK